MQECGLAYLLSMPLGLLLALLLQLGQPLLQLSHRRLRLQTDKSKEAEVSRCCLEPSFDWDSLVRFALRTCVSLSNVAILSASATLSFSVVSLVSCQQRVGVRDKNTDEP